MTNPYTYKVLDVLRVIDGDTVHLRVDLGFGVFIDERFRLEGIDTPELVGTSTSVHAAAVVARDWLEVEIRKALPLLWVQSIKLDSFRRWLGTLWVVTPHAVPVSLNERLLAAGLAVPFKR
jgi:micrococcal nuclease